MEIEKHPGPQNNNNDNISAPGDFHEKGIHNVDPLTDLEVQQGHLQELEVDIGAVLEDTEVGDYSKDTSPFPSVRAVVPETDDTGMPVNTLRAWFLGIVSAYGWLR